MSWSAWSMFDGSICRERLDDEGVGDGHLQYLTPEGIQKLYEHLLDAQRALALSCTFIAGVYSHRGLTLEETLQQESYVDVNRPREAIDALIERLEAGGDA